MGLFSKSKKSPFAIVTHNEVPKPETDEGWAAETGNLQDEAEEAAKAVINLELIKVKAKMVHENSSTGNQFVYVLKCTGTVNHPEKSVYYTGMTNNFERRLEEHQGKKSQYTSRFDKIEPMAYTIVDSRSQAAVLEKRLKRNRWWRLALARDVDLPEHQMKSYFDKYVEQVTKLIGHVPKIWLFSQDNRMMDLSRYITGVPL